jgi:hypothetical protein
MCAGLGSTCHRPADRHVAQRCKCKLCVPRLTHAAGAFLSSSSSSRFAHGFSATGPTERRVRPWYLGTLCLKDDASAMQ